MFYTSSSPAWTLWKQGSLPLNPALAAKSNALKTAVQKAGAAADVAFEQARLHQFSNFIKGVQKYQAHAVVRPENPHPVVWEEGTTKVRQYFKGTPRKTRKKNIVLMTPSLVNRADILDLMPGRSLVDYLADQGLSPYLIDWCAPGEPEKDFGLENYIHRLNNILKFLADKHGAKIHLLGYCMGGTMSIASAVLAPDLIQSLALLAAPWAFHIKEFESFTNPAHLQQLVKLSTTWQREMPVDVLQMLFYAVDPFSAFNKFLNFATLNDTAKEKTFVLVEDWLNDGVPLTKKVALETFVGWYGENAPAHGAWIIDGTTIEPKNVDVPTLLIQPRQDSIVPPASSLPLKQMIRHIDVLQPDTGHIGMIASNRAIETIWQPLTQFLKKQS